jgi:glycosyltransferase involved in cell wall biosynthesis
MTSRMPGRLDHLAGIAANEALLARWQSAAANWVAALPDEPPQQRFLLEAFELFLDRCDGGARLIVLARDVDAAGLDAFDEAVAACAFAAHVECLVDADDAAIKAALLSADALLLAAAHGDLVRAAATLGTPVVTIAADAAAIAAGLAWDTPDPRLLAATVEYLRAEPVLRTCLRERAFAWVVGATPARGAGA